MVAGISMRRHGCGVSSSEPSCPQRSTILSSEGSRFTCASAELQHRNSRTTSTPAGIAYITAGRCGQCVEANVTVDKANHRRRLASKRHWRQSSDGRPSVSFLLNNNPRHARARGQTLLLLGCVQVPHCHLSNHKYSETHKPSLFISRPPPPPP